MDGCGGVVQVLLIVDVAKGVYPDQTEPGSTGKISPWPVATG